MEKKITRPQIKKLLEENGEVELDLFAKGKDPNHFMTAIFQVKITDISELDGRVKESFRKSFGHEQFSIAIWEDKE